MTGTDGARWPDALIRDLRRLELLIEKIVDYFYRIQRDEAPPRRRPKPLHHSGPAPAVQNFHFEDAKKGGAIVSFDGGKPVRLPPAVGELIAILASDTGPSTDELIAFKSFDQVGERLEKRFGRTFRHRNVSQLLLRLRKALRAAGLDPRLVESSPSMGVRLRVKRHPALPGGSTET